jgi:hypothetical protein
VSKAYQEVLDRQLESRKAFGKMLLNWRLSNGWTQYTACKWAKEAGFEIISYGNLSVLEQGKAGELRHKAFFQLGEMNRRLNEQKDLLAIKDTHIRSLVEHAKPIMSDEDEVLGVVQLWSVYTGYLEVPRRYGSPPAPLLTSKQAVEMCNKWRTRVQAALKLRGGDLTESLSSLVNQTPHEHRARFSAVLLFDNYTPGELQALWRDGKYLPDVWLNEWHTPWNA